MPLPLIPLAIGAAFYGWMINEKKKEQSFAYSYEEHLRQWLTEARGENSICFIGRTSSGKSSTINALLGYQSSQVCVKHGTTKEVILAGQIPGFNIFDTPGLLDDIDSSDLVWNYVRKSKVTVFVTEGQLAREELDYISKIYDQYNSVQQYSTRTIILFINKNDVRKVRMDNDELQVEYENICQQVYKWIPNNNIVIGSSSPIINKERVNPDIKDLRNLIELNIYRISGE
jgi:small GTP-binding protein